MPAVDEFIANGKSIEEINQTIGSDRLFYQTLEDLIEVTMRKGSELDGFDSSCFNGEYITGDIDSEYLDRLSAARNDASKIQETMDAERSIDMHTHQI